MNAEDGRPIARLRRLATALAGSQTVSPEDAAWFVGAVTKYEAANWAGLHMRLDATLGLGAPGHVTWRRAELRDKRDRLLRNLRRQYFRDLGPWQAAESVALLVRRFEASQLQPDRVKQDAALEAVAEILLLGQAVPGPRQLARLFTD